MLTGRLAGASVAAIQAEGVVSTVKHFTLNAQETGRVMADSRIEEAAHRESDLLAFQLAIEDGRPGSVMPGYNLVNGHYAGENAHLINDILKGEWGYDGWGHVGLGRHPQHREGRGGGADCLTMSSVTS